ncbi:MAG TPA: cytochrome c3 family protein [Bacteroidota bacterium]|nr:cytochrome c3 family protein [Bacteroidota bacterium]
MNQEDVHTGNAHRITFLGFVALLTLILVVTVGSRSTEVQSETGGLKFVHETHVTGAGIQCVECHDAALRSTLSSDNLLSTKTNCQSCHEEQLNEQCTFCHTSDDPTTYKKLATVDRELIFAHQQHVLETNNIKCETCHSNLDRKKDFIGELVPAMATCTTCHNGVQQSNTCESCHTNLVNLRPADHDRTDFQREHKRLVRSGSTNCATCHTQESCNDCHLTAGLTAPDKSGRDRGTSRSPRISTIDRGRSSALTFVHDLNFKFTHSILAKGKSADCQTCHRAEEFCSSCHAAGGNVNQSAFKPATHQETGFVTIGVGSGGGKHAQMARRDLESCASCHGVDATDPTCTTCHSDTDGVRGTDPKTHQRGFLSRVNGPWHTDQGVTCFVCHTDPNARAGGVRGNGFCGYCHN